MLVDFWLLVGQVFFLCCDLALQWERSYMKAGNGEQKIKKVADRFRDAHVENEYFQHGFGF